MFLFSNLSLFILLPFAYLFTESEGFFGHRKGLMARVYETFVVLALLGMVVLGMTYVISALIDKDNSSIQTILSKSNIVLLKSVQVNFKFVSDLTTYYLPFLYSCISFLGVLILLGKSFHNLMCKNPEINLYFQCVRHWDLYVYLTSSDNF